MLEQERVFMLDGTKKVRTSVHWVLKMSWLNMYLGLKYWLPG